MQESAERTIIKTDEAPPAIGPYSQGVAVSIGNERIVFVSGQLPVKPGTKVVVPGGIAEQVKQALTNLMAVVTKAGGTSDHIGKVNISMINKSDFGPANEAYEAFFTELECDSSPARACVGAAWLPGPDGALIEIEAIVVAPEPLES